jgi:3-phosphoshikimate 1-carboxyvinyltransferase
MAALSAERNQDLAIWAANPHVNPEDHRFTWDPKSSQKPDPELVIEGEGWEGFQAPGKALDCGNSGTTMRLLMGALAGAEFASDLEGDEALSTRPMERVAGPLRSLGADVTTRDGHAPVSVQGAPLHGETVRLDLPSS